MIQVPDAEALYTGELYTNPNDFSSKVSLLMCDKKGGKTVGAVLYCTQYCVP